MKTLALAIKKTFVQEVLEAGQQRAGMQLTAPAHKAEEESFWGKMISDWKTLTKMKKVGSTAIIPIRGAISQDDPFAAYFGETTIKAITDNFRAAMADDSTKRIVFDISSPGGYIWGVEALSDEIYAARGKKPGRIAAFTGQMAASAAYWIGSAAEEFYVGSETSEVGSIGVYLAHFDYSEALGKMGVKVTEVTAGEFKGLGSPYTPLDAEDKKILQEDVNHVYGRFVGAVARNRGMDVKEVLKSANGLVFFGSEAQKNGLIDGISTFTEVLKMEDKDKVAKAEQEAQEAKAKADAAEKKAAAAEAALKAATEAAALAERTAAEAECKSIVKDNASREATAEEVAAYVEMGANGRKLFKASMEEAKATRNKLIEKAGLTQEQVNGEKPEASNNSLLMQAAVELGYAPKAA